MKVLGGLLLGLIVIFVAGTLIRSLTKSDPVAPPTVAEAEASARAAAQTAANVRKAAFANTPHTAAARQEYPKKLAEKLHNMGIDGKVTVGGPDSTTLFVSDLLAQGNRSLQIGRNRMLMAEMDAMGFKLIYYGPPGNVKTYAWHIDEIVEGAK